MVGDVIGVLESAETTIVSRHGLDNQNLGGGKLAVGRNSVSGAGTTRSK